MRYPYCSFSSSCNIPHRRFRYDCEGLTKFLRKRERVLSLLLPLRRSSTRLYTSSLPSRVSIIGEMVCRFGVSARKHRSCPLRTSKKSPLFLSLLPPLSPSPHFQATQDHSHKLYSDFTSKYTIGPLFFSSSLLLRDQVTKLIPTSLLSLLLPPLLT